MGSNPSLPTKDIDRKHKWYMHSPVKRGTMGSNPIWSAKINAGVAQLVEQLLAKQQAEGSSPFTRSKFHGELASLVQAYGC